MQAGSQIPPDFRIGFGTEVEEGVGWVNVVVFLVVATPIFIVAWLSYRKRKAKKR